MDGSRKIYCAEAPQASPNAGGTDGCPMPEGWDLKKAPGWGMDGKLLHGMSSEAQGVPINRWCVTVADLKFLRTEVKKAIARKEICPTDRDPFDAQDTKIGPNIYTCCEQYFKPVTKKAGSMSWALMMHPQGCLCDLFITHCWIEGIFEFIEKVLNSWPPGKKAAYVCFLSNPQNLDISALIANPSESPFAKCLESASHMLVVPNHAASIYSRLWCVYEAWLAYKKDRIILTAQYTIPWRDYGTLVGVVLFALVGFATGLSDKTGVRFPFLGCIVTALLARVFDGVEGPDKPWCPSFPLWYILNLIGGFVAGIVPSAVIANWIKKSQNNNADDDISWQDNAAFGFGITFMLFFIATEIDRECAARAQSEAFELRHKFTSVENAECTNPTDSVSIKNEINHDLAQVDEAIEVLLAAGMSTSRLRSAFSDYVNVSRAGSISYANLIVCIGFYISLQVLFFSLPHGDDISFYIFGGITSAVCIALFGVAYYFSALDRRAFGIAATSKIAVFLVLTMFAVTTLNNDLSKSNSMPALVGPLILSFTLISFAASCAGMAGIAQVPGCGPWLAGLLGPNTSIYTRRRGRAAKVSDVVPELESGAG